MENLKSVDQKFAELTQYIKSRPDIFCRQGAVVPTWRTSQGKTRGPYFRLSFREAGRQKSLYLGPSRGLAERVQGVLTAQQHAMTVQRKIACAQARLRAGLRRTKQAWAHELAKAGLHLKGFEVRGWRQLRSVYQSDRTLESDTAK